MSEENTKSKIALVTGAGRGIGRTIAESLARDGMHVICVSKSASSCGGAAESIKENGGLAEALAVDVSSGEEIRKACEQILEKHECEFGYQPKEGTILTCKITPKGKTTPKELEEHWDDMLAYCSEVKGDFAKFVDNAKVETHDVELSFQCDLIIRDRYLRFERNTLS